MESFDITVTRANTNINQSLDFCLFGEFDSWNGYRNIISVPSGIDYNFSINSQSVNFNYNTFPYIFTKGVDSLVLTNSGTLFVTGGGSYSVNVGDVITFTGGIGNITAINNRNFTFLNVGLLSIFINGIFVGSTVAVGGNITVPLYINSVQTDTLNVSANSYPYQSFLNGLSSEKINIKKIRYTVDNNNLSQLNNNLFVVKRSMFGLVKKENISILAYKSPDQFQQNIIDLKTNISISPEISLLCSLAPVNNLSVTFSIFSDSFDLGKKAIKK